MKLINKTNYDIAYLRKLIEWMRKEVGLNPGWITQLVFKPSRSRSWSYSIEHGAKHATIMWKGSKEESHVLAMARVFGFMAQKQDSGRYNRGSVEHQSARIVEKFMAENVGMKLQARTMSQDTVDLLCAKAGVEGFDEALIQPPPTKPRMSPVQKRARKAAQDLARWERKLKLARGKVAKLQKRVAYYAKTVLTSDGCEGRVDGVAGA